MFKKFCAMISLAGVVITAVACGYLFPRHHSLYQMINVFSDDKDALLAGFVFFGLTVFFTSILVLLEQPPEKMSEPQKIPTEPHPVEPVKTEPISSKTEETPIEKPVEKPIEPVVQIPIKPEPIVVQPIVPAEPSPVAYQILFMFQKEGRLLDFLMEDISEVDDESLGGAIRPIHEGCRTILRERLIIEPVISESEGNEISLDKAVNPNDIKLTGNVPPNPPFRGVVVHKGWKLKEVKLPELVAGWSGTVVAPAEVEIQ